MRKDSRKRRETKSSPDTGTAAQPAVQLAAPTLRKTIEVPADYFYRVKERALQRRMKEKELWSEILAEYFAAHAEP